MPVKRILAMRSLFDRAGNLADLDVDIELASGERRTVRASQFMEWYERPLLGSFYAGLLKKANEKLAKGAHNVR